MWVCDSVTDDVRPGRDALGLVVGLVPGGRESGIPIQPTASDRIRMWAPAPEHPSPGLGS